MSLVATPIPCAVEVTRRAALARIVVEAIAAAGREVVAGDLLVVTHKVVSKAEGACVALDAVRPSSAATRWARRHGKDARAVQLALDEATSILRKRHVLITVTRQGLVCANSGVDLSNVDGGRTAVLLPRDPDESAARVYRALRRHYGFAVPVIISDTFGRPWREGLTEVAIGLAGMKPFRDFRGRRDPHGYRLEVTLEAVADELACVAGLACGKLDRAPFCVISGFAWERGPGQARQLLRPAERDLFR